MTRKKLRENLYIMLFRLDFYDIDELEEQAQMFLDDMEDGSAKAKEELSTKFKSVLAKLDDIDTCIASKAKGWTIDRIAKAEITVLRLAVYEILYDDDVPDRVAINEAVELSKVYCADKASKFVNGVLASVVREKDSSKTLQESGEDASSDEAINDDEASNSDKAIGSSDEASNNDKAIGSDEASNNDKAIGSSDEASNNDKAIGSSDETSNSDKVIGSDEASNSDYEENNNN